MPKFSKIEDLYPKDHTKFYENDHSETVDDHSETEVPQQKIVATPKPSKKVRFVEPVAIKECKPVPLKEKIMNICRENLINLVIVLVGFILMSSNNVVNWITENITANPIANMSVRALGAGIVYLVFTIIKQITKISSF